MFSIRWFRFFSSLFVLQKVIFFFRWGRNRFIWTCSTTKSMGKWNIKSNWQIFRNLAHFAENMLGTSVQIRIDFWILNDHFGNFSLNHFGTQFLYSIISHSTFNYKPKSFLEISGEKPLNCAAFPWKASHSHLFYNTLYAQFWINNAFFLISQW